MVDDEFDSWLLEINRGPYMAKCMLTSRLDGSRVEINRNVVEDTIKVVLDWEKDKSADIGGWDLLTAADK